MPYRSRGLGFDLQIKPGRESHRPQQPQVIFAESSFRIANRAQRLVFQIRLSIHKINDAIFHRIEKQSIDGEIPSFGILFSSREFDFRRSPAIQICAVAAKRRDFDDALVLPHEDHPKSCSDGLGVLEKLSHTRRRGVGGDVVILRSNAKQFIAHAPAGEIGDVPALAQTLHHQQRIVTRAGRFGGNWRLWFGHPRGRSSSITIRPYSR